ncbi:MAG: hypothetical protein E7298_04430 [Lachnospiraceae bacterium]|nr:hypothetical protein [Lachnospiraceae bacterium]
MAQSTEDYLDSLLRQAMGVPDPEPQPVVPAPDPEREDILATIDGLTGSNSAILGNAYDENASFTNEGEIEIPTETPVSAEPDTASVEIPEPEILQDMLPDVDAPVASEVMPEDHVVIPEENAIAPEEPVIIPEQEIVIPDEPVIEPDGNLDILPEPEVEVPVIEEPVIEEPVAEEPIVEEPIIEEPIIEEPIIEEPIIEEPIIEEPVIDEPEAEAEAEAAPSLSIDDLDPNDANKALDADMIAALFASANATEEPAVEETTAEEPEAEEPVIEEPVIEEPVVEESAAEEPIIEETEAEEPALEEPAAEEPATAKESDDDNLSPEEIAALLAGDTPLEEISIPESEEEDAPLMPDQEISDLLSALDDLSGEPKAEAEEEPVADDSTVDEAASDEQSGDDTSADAPGDEDSGVDLGGIDLFDTDLSAMLDDVTSSVDSEQTGDSDVSSEDSDLTDLLGSLDDGSGDLSDIGDMLGKDENSELVDPNSETAEALFASDSEDELFDINNLIDEEEEETKGKKKKKFSLFGKKNKDKGNVETLGDGEMLVDPELFDIPEEEGRKEKKPGFFASLFARLFEEVGEDEDGVSGIEQSAVDIAQEGAAENEAILSELEGEEAGGKKKDKKEKKKKEKKEKKKKDKGGNSEGEEGEEAADDSKKKKKKEKKKKEKLPEVPGKKLPRKKVVAIALFCITIGVVITLLAFLLPYSQDIKKAKKFYTTGEYQKTYEYMRGHKLTSEDKLLYDRTTTLLRIKRPYDSYQNYMKLGYRMEALNALVQGVQMIDTYAEDAASLGINDKYSKQSRLIYDELYNTFGVTVERARSWIALEGTPEYTRALYECLLDTSAVHDEQTLPEDLFGGNTGNPDSVINAEENNL